MVPIDRLLRPLLNHLLAQASWATGRLKAFAGAQAAIEAGPVKLWLLVDAQGLFAAGDAANPSAVTITLPADTPVRFMLDRQGIFQSAKLSGSADFAECLGFVFRHLEWDSEADLARFLGDIPARRLDQAVRGSVKQAGESLARLGRNVAEYVTEESELLVSPQEIEHFNQAVSTLRDDLARLEKRLQRLA